MNDLCRKVSGLKDFMKRFFKARNWYVFLLPFLAVFVVFSVYPILYTLILSCSETSLRGIERVTGLKNYATLISDPLFWVAFRNTFRYTLAYLVVGMSLALLFAVLLNRRIRFVGLFRALFFIPVITSDVAVAKIWMQLYQGEFGPLNRLLAPIGLQVGWLTNPRVVMWSIAVLAIWQGLGYYIVLFLSGLQGIPDELYEAAEIDGAGPVRRFFSITIPSLSATIVLTCIMATINCLQVFTPIQLITEGGPANSSVTIGYYLYRQAFEWINRGYASTLAMALFLIILAITMAQNYAINRWLGGGRA